MKRYFFLLTGIMLLLQASGQGLVSSAPAKLMVYFGKSDATDAVMSSESLVILYDNLQMTGTLQINSLFTEDIGLQQALDSVSLEKITFTTLIPESELVFKENLNSVFSTETELFVGDIRSRFMLEFEISNKQATMTNTYILTCTGTLSLYNNLGIVPGSDFLDKFSFQFFQTVRALTY